MPAGSFIANQNCCYHLITVDRQKNVCNKIIQDIYFFNLAVFVIFVISCFEKNNCGHLQCFPHSLSAALNITGMWHLRVLTLYI